jgi:hypothetical protein
VDVHGTDPLDPDTDNGGVADGAELSGDGDPLDGTDDARYMGGGALGCSSGGSVPGGALLLVVLAIGLVARREGVSR